jgi:peptidoglycan/xylan/chitin deacetylase (PgdA/CDA1 family)
VFVRRNRILVALAALAAALGALTLVLALVGTTASRPKALHARAVPVTTRRTATRRPRLVQGPHDAPVPILMYHVIARAPASAPYPQLFVSRSDFAGQMAWLARRGYHAVTLRRVYDYWTRGVALPPRPIVVSFDDGYLNDYTDALPVLHGHRWSGVLNLEVNNLRPGDLTPYQVRMLIRAGWEVDAHTITHPDLTTVGDAQLRREVAGSREELRRRFGVPVDFFCYPAGRYDARVVNAVRLAGYLGATTTNYGLARPPDYYTLPRIRIGGSEGVARFATEMRRLRP